jgi:iron-sulfur cluster insertion protein
MTQRKVVFTENAARKVVELRKQEGDDNLMLRVEVNGGGCSGFQYKIDFDSIEKSDDHKFERNGVSLLIDAMSMEFMEGAEVDYVEELIGSSFQIKNPNATASCGCGTSFSIM